MNHTYELLNNWLHHGESQQRLQCKIRIKLCRKDCEAKNRRPFMKILCFFTFLHVSNLHDSLACKAKKARKLKKSNVNVDISIKMKALLTRVENIDKEHHQEATKFVTFTSFTFQCRNLGE